MVVTLESWLAQSVGLCLMLVISKLRFSIRFGEFVVGAPFPLLKPEMARYPMINYVTLGTVSRYLSSLSIQVLA